MKNWPDPSVCWPLGNRKLCNTWKSILYWLLGDWGPSSGAIQSLLSIPTANTCDVSVCVHTDACSRGYCVQPLVQMHLGAFLCMFSGGCLLPVCVCQCVQGELGCQWTEGLVAVWKTFAPQSGVCETVCVCVERLGGIVALKGLMWRLMQRDNTGFVSTVPMSLVSYSPVEVYSNPMVREKGGGGIPVMMSVVWESKTLRKGSHMKWTKSNPYLNRWKELVRCCLAHRYVLSCFGLWDRNQRPACFFNLHIWSFVATVCVCFGFMQLIDTDSREICLLMRSIDYSDQCGQHV